MEKYKNHSDLSDWILWVSRNDTKAAKIGRQDKLLKSNADHSKPPKQWVRSAPYVWSPRINLL